VIILVCATVAMVHFQALSAKALSVDDNQYLMENILVRRPSWDSTATFLREVRKPSTVRGYYQPLSMISLMLDYAMGAREDDPRIFHRTSLALHVANTAMIVVLIYLLFDSPIVAGLVGLLFGLHPMTVEPIPWLSERKTRLAATFSFMCLVFYVRYARTGSRTCYTGSIVALILALMSKPTSTPLPVGLLLLDYYPLRRLKWRTVLEKIPFFIIAGISAIITLHSQGATIGVRMPSKDPFLRIPLVICHNIVFYLHKIFFPVNITSHYPPPQTVSLSHPAVLVGVIGTMILLAGLILSLKYTRAVAGGWGFFFIVIFPTIGVVGFTHSLTSDKFAYLPSVGLLVIIAGLLHWVWNYRKTGSGINAARAGVCAVVLAVAAAEAVATRKYLPHWKDTETLYRHMLTHAPNSEWVRMDLAVELTDQDRTDESIKLLREALQIKPTAKIHHNLGIALSQTGRIDEAIQCYKEALNLDPEIAGAHNGLGTALRKKGKLPEAVVHYTEAIRLDPYADQAHHNLGTTYLALGKTDDAIASYKKAIELQPERHYAYHGVGVALTHKGDISEAIKYHRRAVQLKGDHLGSVNELARLLISVPQEDPSKGAEPVRLAKRCCELTGYQEPRYLHTLAAAHAGIGQFDQAVKHAQRAITLAEAAGQDSLAKQIRARLDLYREGKTFRKSPDAKPATNPSDRGLRGQ
jgi:Flp pilus assembly protein TadD